MSSVSARRSAPARAARSPAIFVVTGLGLLSVGATLPVLPRYVTGRSTAATSRSGSSPAPSRSPGSPAGRSPATSPTAAGAGGSSSAGSLATAISGLLLLRPGRRPGPDRRAAVPRRRRGRRLHRRLGVDRRPGAARSPRADHRPLRARDLGRAGARAADRRADPAGDELRGGLGVRDRGAARRRAGRDPDPGALRPAARPRRRTRRCSPARRCGPGSASRWRSSATPRWRRSSSCTSTSSGDRPRRRRVRGLRRQRRRDARGRRLAAGPLRADPLRVGAGIVEAAGLLVIAAAELGRGRGARRGRDGRRLRAAVPVAGAAGRQPGPDERRGVAMGTFTAFFDLGMGIGGPLAGAAAATRRLRGRLRARRRLRAGDGRGRRLASRSGRGDPGAGAGGLVDEAVAQLADGEAPHRERERDSAATRRRSTASKPKAAPGPARRAGRAG